MNIKQIKILLVALVFLNILDGDFINPSALDIVKFMLLGGCLILAFKKE